MKIAVAMSGGVDSSVAAALLKKAGHEITGLTMQLADGSRSEADAAVVARCLDIPHRVIDLREVFADRVIDPFCREYRAGRTPNPCIWCNACIKFGALWEEAVKLGAEALATGHYARVEKDGGAYFLKKGTDATKDQSYFLYRLSQEQLARTVFPVGGLSKPEVRKMAADLGLPSVSRPESNEICFIPDNDHAAFLESYMREPSPPGPILDASGRTLGRHRGIASYTIGQRKGLGIAAPEPLYVTAIRPEDNAVIAGARQDTYGAELVAAGLHWISIAPPRRPVNLRARIRYRHAAADAVVTPLENDAFSVKFNEPQMAITPGQAVVFYQGDKVVGGGTIMKRGS